MLADYGRTLAEARRQYRAYVQACVLEDDGPLIEALAASRYAIGGSGFVEETERRLTQRRSGAARDQDLDLPQAIVPLELIDEKVATHFGLECEDLARSAAGDGTAKFVAVELACRLTGMTQRAIGVHYGKITSAAVSNIRRRLRQGQYTCSDIVEKLGRRIRLVSS